VNLYVHVTKVILNVTVVHLYIIQSRLQLDIKGTDFHQSMMLGWEEVEQNIKIICMRCMNTFFDDDMLSCC
jgi:hypothetical protein